MKDGPVTYARKVETGYTMDDAAAIDKKLLRMAEKTPNRGGSCSAARFIHWVRPELLCEVKFADGRKAADIARLKKNRFRK